MLKSINERYGYSSEKATVFLDSLKSDYLHHNVGLLLALLDWNEKFALMDYIHPDKPEDELTYSSVREDNIVFLSVFMNTMLVDFFEGGENSGEYNTAKEFIEEMIEYSKTDEFKSYYS